MFQYLDAANYCKKELGDKKKVVDMLNIAENLSKQSEEYKIDGKVK